LNDSKVTKANQQTVKKKFTFEIVTPNRTYYVSCASDEEVDQWMDAIAKAKAKYLSDVALRESFTAEEKNTNAQ